MKAVRLIVSGIFATLVLASGYQARAQFMPVVYDNTYGKGYQMTTACADFQNGDVVVAGTSSGSVVLTWIDREGETRFSKRFIADEFTGVSRIIPLAEDKVLVVGQRSASQDTKRPAAAGRAMVINVRGLAERTIQLGANGTVVTNGKLLASGNLILSGSTPNSAGTRSGFISKVSPAGRVVYTYTAANGGNCDWFDVQGSRTEYLNAAFSSPEKDGASVVRLDENGKPYFITTIPDASFKIEKMAVSPEGDVYLAGQGKQLGGAVIKIRQEGDIVFQKQIAPATEKTRLNHLLLCPTGELLVGGNDSNNSFFALLRSDGTELLSSVDNGVVTAIAGNPFNGECVISLYDEVPAKGKIVKISKQGRKLYEKTTAANYTAMTINGNGDLLLASPQSGRLSMLSAMGELLFDRYVVENTPTQFQAAYLPSNGEAVFMDKGNRLAKLAHGVYVSDISVTKPINGHTSAVFTVTLSGYSFSKEGAPLPVTVHYKTKPLTASEGVNYNPVEGTLSFVPSSDGSDRYLSKFVVEVPVNANNLLEGFRTFSLDLSDVKQSYLIKSSSTATIEDQPAVVKMIRTTPGTEATQDVIYELGIFKRDGTALTNSTKTDIIIDGVYGSGTADALDFDMGRIPRLVIPSGRNSGTFNVVTLEDTRYEAAKTVVVNFSKVYAMSDTEVSFGSNFLSCEGTLYDQPAMVAIESLGDHTNRNNAMSGLFKVSLVRAKDGVLQTNNSGADIMLSTAVGEAGTAKQGLDFVIANGHDLRISGDGRSSAVNLNGLVLFNPANTAPKSVVVNLQGVKAGANSAPISISPAKNSAKFTINNE